jgi:carboxyl-terminal processing protease
MLPMPKRNLIWLAALLAVAMVALLCTHPSQHSDSTAARAEFDPVTKAYHTIKDCYFYPIEDDLVRRRAIEGMVAQLDEFSTYVPPAQAEAFADRMAGQAWGLGLKVEVSAGKVLVIGPLAHSPAQQSGLLPGDCILQIDGQDVTPLSQADVEGLLDGPSQDPVKILVRRRDGEEQVLRCRRGKFPLEAVQGLFRGGAGEWVCLIDPNAGLAYVRIREVFPSTPEQLRGTLRQMDRLRAIVLDLRDNPGGDFGSAVELANMFIDEGTIVSVKGRGGRTDHAADPAHHEVRDEVRVVALIDAKTASAAELVAGALAYHDRAVLVGRRTRGKGCIQSMIPLEGEMGRLNLTTSEFFVDPLHPIQRRKDSNAWGVEPHVTVKMPSEFASALASLRAKAEVVRPGPATRPTTLAAEEDDTGALLLRFDPQLQRAIALAGNPAELDEILRQAAQARALATTRAATASAAAATQPARTGPQ